ncbi:MAG: CPBP family intramembrane glutamic endopeptidase [Clostridiaceae bacterium]
MKERMKRIIEFILVLLLGLITFVLFSHVRPILSGSYDLIGRVSFISALLLCALLARKSDRLKKYWEVMFAFFIAAAATSVDYYLPSGRWLLCVLNIPMQTPAGIAIDKLDSSIIIIGLLVVLTRISGSSLDSIFITRQNIRKGITIGVIMFMIAAAGSVFIADIYGAQNIAPARIFRWIPWILIFIAGNSLNEELLFRGLFLRKTGAFIGNFPSNLVFAIPFVLHHTGVTYTNDAILFLAYLLPLSLVWGYLMQKTGSLWASVLFHAGTDIPIALVIFSQIS